MSAAGNMSRLEGKLRQALEETAREIPAAGLAALSLAPRPGRSRIRAWRSHAATSVRGAQNRWAAPVAAAAAVAVVIAVSVAIAGRPAATSRERGRSTLASLGAGTTFRLRTAPAVDGGEVPGYEVAAGAFGASPVRVLATATGAVLAAVRSPDPSTGQLVVESGAANDRAFVLGDQIGQRIRLYLLRLYPHDGKAVLNALPISVTNNSSLQFAGLAVSPDGSKLAIAVNNRASAARSRPQVWVYDLATGSRREWLWPGFIVMRSLTGPIQAPLSWAAGNTLAFDIDPGMDSVTTVRLLDTEAPGKDLSNSSVVVRAYQRLKSPAVSVGSAMITPDGTRVVLGQYQTGASRRGLLPEVISIEEYSAAQPGQLIATRYQQRYQVPLDQDADTGSAPSILWANPSGSVLIVWTGTATAGQSGELGVLRGDTFTPLPELRNPYLEYGTW